jgi:hypothetical protein
MGIVGALVIVFGVAATVNALAINNGFSQDPVCTRSITLATSPRNGKTCSIARGTVSSKYRSETGGSTAHRSIDDHIVVFTSDGPVLDVVLENEFWSRMYDSATRGAPAVVETVDGRPAFIATSNGTLSAEADPQLPLEISWIFIPIGAMLLFVAIRKQPFTLREPRPGSTSRP